jgi:hypothetical protein
MTILRVVLGYVVAALIAGLVQTLFVVTPQDLWAAPDRLGEIALLSAMAGTLSGIFALPFALPVIAVVEWLGARSWIGYALAGIGVAMAGFIVLIAAEPPDRTILNDYAFRAFLTSGFFGGLTYWAIAGRRAGGSRPGSPEGPPRSDNSAEASGSPHIAKP